MKYIFALIHDAMMISCATFWLSAAFSPSLATPLVVETLFCKLVEDPKSFDGKTVRVNAAYIEHLHGVLMRDIRCSGAGAVVVASLSEAASVKLNAALLGCPRSMGATLMVTATGEFHWDPKSVFGSARPPRTIDIQTLDNIRVETPICVQN